MGLMGRTTVTWMSGRIAVAAVGNRSVTCVFAVMVAVFMRVCLMVGAILLSICLSLRVMMCLDNVGLFGSFSGRLQNLHLVNARVSIGYGATSVGGLVGYGERWPVMKICRLRVAVW